MTVRGDAETSRTPSVWAAREPRANGRSASTMRAVWTRIGDSSLDGSGEPIERALEAVCSTQRRDAVVVDRRVGIEPVRPRIDVEREDFREVRALQEQLPPR